MEDSNEKLQNIPQSADISSDHNLEMCEIQLRLKKDQRGKRQQKKDTEALQLQEVRRAYKERIVQGIENDMMDQAFELNERAQN